MSQCNHRKCIDVAVVTVDFPSGESREYCRFHAQHVGKMVGSLT